jgi:hypothetical protein
LTNARGQLGAVAFSYALLGALYCFFAASLIDFSWTGSWSQLWQDLGAYSANSVALFGGIALGHWILAGLSLRYLALDRTWRGLTLIASLLLALWNIGAAVRLTILGAAEALEFMPTPTVFAGKWLFALAYAICSYLLWEHRGASNNRWSGP